MKEGSFLNFIMYLRKTSAKGKEVKGSEETDQLGLVVVCPSGIFLGLRWICTEGDSSEMPKMRSSFYS
jgi:hypothetical protein